MIRMSNFDPDEPGASEAFNDFAKVLDDIAAAMSAGLEVDASILASTMSSYFTSLTAGLREIMPELPALPNINLQAQLASLSTLTVGSDRHTTLLNEITSNFDTELSAGGFSLDTLVTNARTAVDAGDTLSGIVPNFAKAADGVTDAFQIADAVKQATEDSVKGTASTFTVSDALTSRISAIDTNVEAALAAIT